MRWFVIAVLGLGLVLPMLATDSFASAPGKSGASNSGVAGQPGNQGSGPNSGAGNAGGTRKSE